MYLVVHDKEPQDSGSDWHHSNWLHARLVGRPERLGAQASPASPPLRALPPPPDAAPPREYRSRTQIAILIITTLPGGSALDAHPVRSPSGRCLKEQEDKERERRRMSAEGCLVAPEPHVGDGFGSSLSASSDCSPGILAVGAPTAGTPVGEGTGFEDLDSRDQWSSHWSSSVPPGGAGGPGAVLTYRCSRSC